MYLAERVVVYLGKSLRKKLPAMQRIIHLRPLPLDVRY